MKSSLICSIALFAISTGTAWAEPQRGTGIICRTSHEVEMIFDNGSKAVGETIVEAIEATNKQNGNEDCALKSIMYERGKNVAIAKHADVTFDIAEITVVAVCENGFCIFGKQDVAYSVFKREQTGSLLFPRMIGVYYASDLMAFHPGLIGR